ncbi:TRAP-type mannitol/chloroaromatic compound transport system, substrate-binding protein [Faunimonas pinastri]|uniref:TRAP-type mannitol/chloroaromatic compound transport system, substrate-binding protein n=1 Tax=Faunimonas pinastri TaxID=1855383 RepID=A0A1H8ZZ26_9HYPH|nr:TRAP transporter substrate-binding protein [Faunimonas pinastri]SEP69679.1 TRAP-type mannitol/chloroaromatic compound transport system, substrate-binding protein [Faunimonas pinastri]
MKRRDVLKAAGLGIAGASTLAMPAIAQATPELKWRMTSSFPKSMDVLYGNGELVAKYVAEATDNKFQIQLFAPGEIVPALQALDAVANNTIEMAHTCSYYYWGKDPAFAFGTAVPFGLNSRMQNAWMYYGGGIELMNEFYAKFGVVGFPAGNTGAQMGGWFRKEINTPEDLKGLKMRIAGFGGAVLQKLGVIPQQIAGGDIYPSLEKGTIDAAEWVGPYDDEKIGFYKVAPYYYYPGFWEGGAYLHAFINKAKYDALPDSYKQALQIATKAATSDMQARYDMVNPPAMKRLAQAGAKLRPFSQQVLSACFDAAQQSYDELNAKNADFKKMYDSMMAYRRDAFLWFQVSEYPADTFLMVQQREGKL